MRSSYLVTITILLVVVWMGLLVMGKLPIKTYLVQSGSMEPSIMVGDVILVREADDYNEPDVITFVDSTNRVVTHRVVEVNRDGSLTTKGDANEDEDRETIRADKVVGKVWLTVPKLGFVVKVMRSPVGFLLMILLPAVYLVVSEVISISKAVRKR